jgi:hypothetical protein
MANSPLEKIVISDIGRGAQLKYGPGNNQYCRASDFNPVVDYVNNFAGVNAVTSTQTGTTNTTNAVAGVVTFTSQSVAAGANATYTITNSNVTTSSIVNVNITSATAGALPLVVKVVPAAGSFAVTILNFTGATTYTSITFSFQVF